MDHISYAYDAGNKLLSVTEQSGGNITYGFKDGNTTGNDYAYDANGNLISDANKGITSISYNHLNLPTQVTINGQNINYIYDAAGVKIRKTVGSTTTDYAGNHIYENNNLQFFSHPEGYVTPDGSGGYDYIYQYKDHLGNIRLSYSDADGNGTVSQSEIIEENNYYPFGLTHKGYNNNVSSNGNSLAQRYKYNGKELNEELGLDWYDFTARNYDASLGRWMNIDPLADQYVNITPYAFVANMPTIAIDPDGKRIIIVGDQDYRNAIFLALIELGSTEAGLKKLQNLINSDQDFVIGNVLGEDGKKNRYLGVTKKDGRFIHTININLNDTNKDDIGSGDGPNTTATSVAHEIGHADDALSFYEKNGAFPGSMGHRMADREGGPSARIEELDNVHFENVVRSSLNLELRKTYNGVNVVNMSLSNTRVNDSKGDSAFLLNPNPDHMQFDYSSVPKASFSSTLRSIGNFFKSFSHQSKSLSNWESKRIKFKKDASQAATIFSGKKE